MYLYFSVLNPIVCFVFQKLWNYRIGITCFFSTIMPRQSKRQNLLQTLKSAKLDLQLAHYFDSVQAALRLIEDSDSDSNADTDMSPPSPITSMSSMSSIVITDLESLLASSEGTPYLTLDRTFIEFESIITALHDEVEKLHYLVDWSRTRPSQAP